MISRFFPKEFNFFDLFDKQVACAVEAAAYFKEVAQKGGFDAKALEKIHSIEHQADEIAHTVIEQLNKTFITPFDREDIHALIKQLDDVVDMINTIANRLVVYKLSKYDKNLAEFSKVIHESVKGVACAVNAMRTMKGFQKVSEACVEINRLENVGDAMRDMVLAELFETEKDPIAVIKWKEIYQDSETVLDICEDCAHVVESILVKQA